MNFESFRRYLDVDDVTNNEWISYVVKDDVMLTMKSEYDNNFHIVEYVQVIYPDEDCGTVTLCIQIDGHRDNPISLQLDGWNEEVRVYKEQPRNDIKNVSIDYLLKHNIISLDDHDGEFHLYCIGDNNGYELRHEGRKVCIIGFSHKNAVWSFTESEIPFTSTRFDISGDTNLDLVCV